MNLMEIINNPKYKLKLTYPYAEGGQTKLDTLVGFVSSDFSLSGSSSFESLFGGTIFGEKTIAQLQYAAPQILDRLTNGQAIKVKSPHQIVNYWTGSSESSYSITFIVPRLSMRESSVIDRVKNLQKAVMGSWDNSKIVHPWRPTRDLANNVFQIPPGTASLEIGEWLRLHGLLINNVSVNYSKEVVKDGTPLHASVSVGLMPWRMEFSEDVNMWYSGHGGE